MTRQYRAIYEWSGKNFSAYAPDVQGCIATGKTLPLMRSALKGALEAHLPWIHNDGETIPAASEKVTLDMEPDSEFPFPRGYYVIVEQLPVTLPKARTLTHKLTKVKAIPRSRTLQVA